MGTRGPKPGAKKVEGSGRKPGSVNKITIAKAQEIASSSQAKGRKIAKDVLDDVMHIFLGLAAKHQPGSERENEKAFVEYVEKAAQVATWLAPYQSPRMQSVAIQHLPPNMQALNDADLALLAALHQKATDVRGDTGGDRETSH